jgi:two-component system KDP operon response regulator KdpE
MSGQRILVVDDEPQIRRALDIALRGHDYDVQLADGSAAALVQLGAHPPELLILDLMLPDLDGLSLLRELRSWSDIPVIVLSARGEEATKIEALDLGADDYLTKPFGIGELLARVRALLRRGKDAPAPMLDLGGVTIDLANHRVWRDGVEVHLTRTEFELLAVLAQNRGKLMTHRQILQQVWGSYATENVQQLRVYINYLRTKLERDPHSPTLILTEPGVGYRLSDDPASAL